MKPYQSTNATPTTPESPILSPEHLQQALYLQEKQALRKCCSALCGIGFLTSVAFGVFPLLLEALLTVLNIEAGLAGLSPTWYHFSSICLYLLSLGVPALIYLVLSHTPVMQVLPFEKARPFSWILLIIVGTAVCLLANFPADWVTTLLDQLGFPPPVYPIYLDGNPLSAIFYFISIALVPPLVEEFLFRGIILQKLKGYGSWFAIITSSLLFALFHGNFAQAVFAFICGIALAFVTLKTGNWWPAFFIHLLNNGNSAVSDLLSFYVNEAFANTVHSLVFVAAVFFAVLCAFVLLLQDRKSFRLVSESTTSLRVRSKCHALFWSVGGILFWISSILQMVFTLQG